MSHSHANYEFSKDIELTTYWSDEQLRSVSITQEIRSYFEWKMPHITRQLCNAPFCSAKSKLLI
jgi:hypothetical protein